MDGLFVMVKGADGSGKSAAVHHLVTRLQHDGHPVRRIDRDRPSGLPEYANLIKAVATVFRSSQAMEPAVVVEATEQDRVRWYAAGERKEPIYDLAGRRSRDPVEFGRFTE
jgi:thymidylate kinase